MRILLIYSTAILMLGSIMACAQTKKATSRNPYFDVKAATVRKTLMGRQESGARISYHFTIIWKSKEKPSVFYWRPNAYEWSDVSVAYPERRAGVVAGDYMIVEKTKKYSDIKAGDELIVSPHSHSDEAEDMPKELVKKPGSALYFKVDGKWKYQVLKPKKLPDIVMP
ncbi:MAG: hypothetical protein ABI378_08445 [Chitinophagaceae bacterium]